MMKTEDDIRARMARIETKLSKMDALRQHPVHHIGAQGNWLIHRAELDLLRWVLDEEHRKQEVAP